MTHWLVDLVRGVGGPWAYLIVAASTALEASAFVGLFVPGETMLLLSGFLVQQGALSRLGTMAAAAAGAIIGDSIGYEIGRRFGDRLVSTRVGRWVGHDRIDRARDLLRRHGPSAIFTGRFIGVLRAVVPAAAGDAGVPYGRFLVWNVLGGVIWAPAVVLVGEAVGASYDAVGQWIGRVSVAIVVLAVVGRVIWKRVRRHPSDARSSS